jgi:threonine dehydratase
MPSSTSRNYIEATRGYGAEICFANSIQQAFETAHRLRDQGLALVHPFDDPLVAAGQGTVALEILHDLPSLSRIYISIGGGGLIAGMAAALKALKPDVHIVGVETVGADAMYRSRQSDQLIELKEITSIARTLGAPRVSEFTLSHVKKLVDELIVVSDHDTVEAMVYLLERTKTLVEPAGACCLAAARKQASSIGTNESTTILLCGGNSSVEDLSSWSKQFSASKC